MVHFDISRFDLWVILRHFFSVNVYI